MAAPKFLAVVNGIRKIMTATVTSAADSIVATDATGKIDVSVLPSGIGANTRTAQAGEALAANDLVYIDSAGKAFKADATSAAKGALFFTKASVLLNGSATLYGSGNAITGLTGLTPGQAYFLSRSTPGGYVDGATTNSYTTSGNLVQYIGTADSTTSIMFEPDELGFQVA